MENDEEEWRPVLGYEGLYEVSSFGRIKSVGRTVIIGEDSYRYISERILKLCKDSSGYCQVGLYENGQTKTRKVHKLVAESFLGHKRGLGFKEVVDHIDHNPRNNCVDNLRLVTNRENSSYIRGVSKYTGVYLNKRRGKYRASIRVNNKKVDLGSHKDEKVCAQWYQDALRSLETDPTGKSVVRHTRKPTSRYIGVNFHKCTGKWRSYVTVNGKSKHIGRYGCETAAYLAREKFIKENQQLFNN